MNKKVVYEWCYELLDENRDIIDSYFSDRLCDFASNEKTETLCLIRNEGSADEGLTDRTWAYVADGALPECFQNAEGVEISIKVPKVFRTELDKYNQSEKK